MLAELPWDNEQQNVGYSQQGENSKTSIIMPENLYLTCKYALKTSINSPVLGLQNHIFGI